MLTRRLMLVLLTVFALVAVLAFAGLPAGTVLAQGPGGTSGSGGGSGGTGAGGTSGTGATGANGAGNFNGVAPNAANSVLLSSNESSGFIGAGTVSPAGGFGVGVFRATGYQTYTIDTAAGLNLSCAAVRVYRVTEKGDLILHPSTCSGNMLSFVSAGTGHYVLYAFGSTNRAQGAQPDVIRSQNGINNNQTTANNNQSGVNNNSQAGINSGAGGTSGQSTTGSNQSGINNNQTTANNNQSGVNNNSQNAANNQSNSALLPQNQSAGMMSFWQNSSVGGRVMGVVFAQGFTQYSINTQQAGNASCGFVSVYRVTESGALIRHPSSCAGGVLTFTSVGTGHYVLFSFGSTSGAQNSTQNGVSAGGSTGSNASSSNNSSSSTNNSSTNSNGSSSSSSTSGMGTGTGTGSNP